MSNIGQVSGYLFEKGSNKISVVFNSLKDTYDFCIDGVFKTPNQQTFILSEQYNSVPYGSLIDMYSNPDLNVLGIKRMNNLSVNLPKTIQELNKPIHTILLDMDEVLVNFKQALVDCNPEYDVNNMYDVAGIFGNKQALISLWISNTIKKNGFETAKPLGFFHTVMDTLLPYWIEKGIKVEILSSLSSNTDNQSKIATQKLRWLSNHKVDLPFTFVKGARNKQNHAKEGVLLIDDYYRNVIQFISAGGYAILADPKNQNDSIIHQLKLLGLTPDNF